MGRVLAVGIDAAEPRLLDELMAAGRMPHLARLRATGAWCPLTTQQEYRAEHPWTVFVTGRGPSTTGRWSPVRFDPHTYRYETVGAFEAEPFYAVGDAATVAALDIPASVLAHELRGSQVLGWGTHDPQFPRCSRPAGLLGDLEAVVGPDRSIPLEYAGAWHQHRWIEAYGSALEAASRDRSDVMRDVLARTPDWSLALTVFNSVHTLGHHCWHGIADDSFLASAPTAAVAREQMVRVHAAFDDALARLHATLEPDDVLAVFSPKGMETAQGEIASMMLLPELLYRRTFGSSLLPCPSLQRWRRAGCPPVIPDVALFPSTYMKRRFAATPAQMRTIERRARLRRLQRVVANAVPGMLDPRTLPMRVPASAPPFEEPPDSSLRPERGTLDRYHVAAWYQPWWSQMPAFVLPSFADTHVRLNVVGRERAGIVEPADYARACDEIEQWLRTCRSARTGRPVVDEVARPRAHDLHDPFGPDADLVVSFTEDPDALEHPDLGSVGPFPASRTGTHSANGFALFVGAGIRPGAVEPHPLADLPATLLALARIEPLRALDGLPISPMFETAVRS